MTIDYKSISLIEGNTIKYFFREYRFLSNFYSGEFKIAGYIYPTVEHYFQSMKAFVIQEAEEIRNASTPGIAKKLGNQCSLRKDWEYVKLDVMKVGVIAKFVQNNDLKEKLINTGFFYLEEGNDWGDKFWGIVNGEGENNLGKILMQTREYLRLKDLQ